MWVLVGRMSYPGEGYEETNIATFDEFEDAQAYVDAAILKNPKPRKKYKQASRLGCYSDVFIEQYEPECLPHNPKIDWK